MDLRNLLLEKKMNRQGTMPGAARLGLDLVRQRHMQQLIHQRGLLGHGPNAMQRMQERAMRPNLERPMLPGRMERPMMPGRMERPMLPGRMERPMLPGRMERPMLPGHMERPMLPGRMERSMLHENMNKSMVPHRPMVPPMNRAMMPRVDRPMMPGQLPLGAQTMRPPPPVNRPPVMNRNAQLGLLGAGGGLQRPPMPGVMPGLQRPQMPGMSLRAQLQAQRMPLGGRGMSLRPVFRQSMSQLKRPHSFHMGSVSEIKRPRKHNVISIPQQDGKALQKAQSDQRAQRPSSSSGTGSSGGTEKPVMGKTTSDNEDKMGGKRLRKSGQRPDDLLTVEANETLLVEDDIEFEEFMTLDAIGDSDDEEDGSETASSATKKTPKKIVLSAADLQLGEYDPTVPVGQQLIVPVTGYFCKLCHKFYSNKRAARVKHCQTESHYQIFNAFLQGKRLLFEARMNEKALSMRGQGDAASTSASKLDSSVETDAASQKMDSGDPETVTSSKTNETLDVSEIDKGVESTDVTAEFAPGDVDDAIATAAPADTGNNVAIESAKQQLSDIKSEPNNCSTPRLSNGAAKVDRKPYASLLKFSGNESLLSNQSSEVDESCNYMTADDVTPDVSANVDVTPDVSTDADVKFELNDKTICEKSAVIKSETSDEASPSDHVSSEKEKSQPSDNDKSPGNVSSQSRNKARRGGGVTRGRGGVGTRR